MRNLKVAEVLPENTKKGFSELLYTQPNFLVGNNLLPQIHFYLFDPVAVIGLGHIGFSLEEGTVFSAYRAPFGGFALADDLTSTEITFFIFEVLRKLKEQGVTSIQMKLAPYCYFDNTLLLKENLVYAGFDLEEKLEYQAIPINDQAFELGLASMEVRKLKKCQEAGFEFSRLPKHKLADVFDFVKNQRQEKGYEFSMEWPQMKLAQKVNPEAYIPFVVKDGERIIAATVGILASDRVLYNFSPAHHSEYDPLSPNVLLTEGLYDFCRAEGLNYLDLGTSYLNGKINKGLWQFKSHLGGQSFFSYSFRKAVS
ncbi:GNAT family N-acetyltransferase [Roseivirga sp.]|uniref:GNAT family N-acetyltransferase n=1 Tax=Roseivirga sp. TaxID=1964215 RepID=UPI002B273A8D|nr:GNAT family N-acetyltransferase [Roseivirga sp.]